MGAVDFSHTLGREEEIERVLEWMKSPLQRPLVLACPPAQGKTFFARAIAGEMGKEPIEFRLTTLPLLGQAREGIKDIAAQFRHAKEESGIVILDEADTFFSKGPTPISDGVGKDLQRFLLISWNESQVPLILLAYTEECNETLNWYQPLIVSWGLDNKP